MLKGVCQWGRDEAFRHLYVRRSVHVEKCSRCVLVLGATSSAVEVTNCDSLTIIAASRRVHIRFVWAGHGV